MSNPQESLGPLPMVTPEDVKQANDRVRRVPTRPGWRALIAVIAFLTGFAFYVTHLGS
jgi:hypothetical protein